jgi:hypothetical protein
MNVHVLLTIVKRLQQCHHVKVNYFDLVVLLQHYLMFIDFVVTRIDLVADFGGVDLVALVWLIPSLSS